MPRFFCPHVLPAFPWQFSVEWKGAGTRDRRGGGLFIQHAARIQTVGTLELMDFPQSSVTSFPFFPDLFAP